MIVPKVTIVIPVFNGSRYLRNSIRSALNQTYSNVEVLVVNDGSTDRGATESICLEFKSDIVYISKKNGGVSSALNEGIARMKGEFFSWLSHDDEYRPEKVEKQIQLIGQHSSAIVAYSGQYIVDENGNTIDPHKQKYPSSNEVLPDLIYCNFLNGCSLLIPKSIFDDVGGFDEALPMTQDYELWVRIAKKYQFVPVKEPLVGYRLHPAQTSALFPVEHRKEEDLVRAEILKNNLKNVHELLRKTKDRGGDLLYLNKLLINLRLNDFDASSTIVSEHMFNQSLLKGFLGSASARIFSMLKILGVLPLLFWLRRIALRI